MWFSADGLQFRVVEVAEGINHAIYVFEEGLQAGVVELSGYVDCVAFVKGVDYAGKAFAKSFDAGVNAPSGGVDRVALCLNLARSLRVESKLCVLIILTDLAFSARLTGICDESLCAGVVDFSGGVSCTYQEAEGAIQRPKGFRRWLAIPVDSGIPTDAAVILHYTH